MSAPAPPSGALTGQASTTQLPWELVTGCVLKTWYAFDPAWQLPDGQHGPTRPESRDRAARRAAFVDQIRHELTGNSAGDETGWSGDPGIVLVPGVSGADGRPRYHPVLPVWHKVLDERRDDGRTDHRPLPAWLAEPVRPSPGVLTTPLGQVDLRSAQRRVGTGLRMIQREADFLRLVAAYLHLVEVGAAADPPLVGIVGTDCLPGDDDGDDLPIVAWLDPWEPVIRTFSRTAAEGWRLRSVIERYRHESAFRAAIADAAASGGAGPAVEPIAIGECGRCAWQPQCWHRLPSDDLSRRLGAGRLDIREVRTLRGHGIRSIADLAVLDDAALTQWYLPEVTHRPDAAHRIQVARRRSRMQVEGRPVERDTHGRITIPGAAVEIDLDVESSSAGAVYLWGFRIAGGVRPAADGTDAAEDTGSRPDPAREDPPSPRAAAAGRYVAFSRFADLSPEAESELAVEALSWLLEQVAADPTARIYHYSSYEPTVIARLAGRTDNAVLERALAVSQTHFVDLYEIVREHFIGAAGLGLKQVAPCAGFHWRDSDPGGLNSQRWFRTAVDAEDPAEREAAAQRVLHYNEDDVAATAALRGWLRGQT